MTILRRRFPTFIFTHTSIHHLAGDQKCVSVNILIFSPVSVYKAVRQNLQLKKKLWTSVNITATETLYVLKSMQKQQQSHRYY